MSLPVWGLRNFPRKRALKELQWKILQANDNKSDICSVEYVENYYLLIFIDNVALYQSDLRHCGGRKKAKSNEAFTEQNDVVDQRKHR